MKQLILGGARSGKSTYAEQQALSLLDQGHSIDCSLWYVATATLEKQSNGEQDKEMYQRVKRHQQQRDTRWQLIEEPLDLATVINQLNSSKDYILIDCLTLWLTNALVNQCWSHVKAEFFQALQASKATIIFVSNEVGSGIVPLGELSRQFVDESGWLHQALAQHCDQVTLVVAGLPLELKNHR